MEKKELYKKMKKLNSLLEDFLDRMDMDEAEEDSGKKDTKEED